MSRQNLNELVAIALDHSNAEAAGDLSRTLGTLEANPVYDLYPLALRFTGADATRRYYLHFFAEVAPKIAGYRMISQWIGDDGVVQEYDIDIALGEYPARTFRVLGILTFGETAMSGERIYADPEVLRFMFASVWNELRPIYPDTALNRFSK